MDRAGPLIGNNSTDAADKGEIMLVQLGTSLNPNHNYETRRSPSFRIEAVLAPKLEVSS